MSQQLTLTAPVIALATGGRDFVPSASSRAQAVELLGRVGVIVEGEARGFDRFIRDTALSAGVLVQPVPALWGLAKMLGRDVGREGSARNARMLSIGRALAAEYGLELVLIAGPGGEGTADMRRRCRGLPVWEIST